MPAPIIKQLVTPETIAPPKGIRMMPGLLVLIIGFIIALAALGANTVLRKGVEKNKQVEDSLLRLQVLTYQLSALEWQSLGEGLISSEIANNIQFTRDGINQIMGELEQLDQNAENIRMVRQSYTVYDSAITEEFRLITAGDLAQAMLFDSEQVDPAFNAFSQVLTSSGKVYDTIETQWDQASNLGFTLLLIFVAAAIALLFWRYQKAQVTAEAAKAEQRALERHRDDFRLLNEMGNNLRTRLTVAEAYDDIANFAQRLFPNVSGALYIINKAPGIFETAVTWGDSPPRLPGPGRAFSPDKCLALRQGQVYDSEDSISPVDLCPYVGQPRPDSYLCVPMLAHGEILGILHLRRSKSPRTSERRSADGMVALNRQLAETVAEHIALALTNLRLQEALQYQAIRDPLTGLFNRRYLEESFKREMDRACRRKLPIGVIMLDIDNFKLYNDTYGHAAGDAVLIEVGTLLKAHVRGEDIPCRYGGEEFLLILPEASLSNTHRRAEQLLNEIQSMSVQFQGQPLPAISFSAGVACYPEHGGTVDSLLTAVDSALYRAKSGGRNQLVVAQTGGD